MNKSNSKICGARNRRGQPCQCKLLLRGNRCKYHGGMSTGAKTPEGKQRIVEALKKWRECKKDELRNPLARPSGSGEI
ncbi:MAG TPA: HGGxSTG domain-containing protein [Burkholderiales bacterium]|nr:HGGxSTG domain-containing protein [Burkholderiales bacterium]